jgi:hypothetical protein
MMRLRIMIIVPAVIIQSAIIYYHFLSAAQRWIIFIQSAALVAPNV